MKTTKRFFSTRKDGLVSKEIVEGNIEEMKSEQELKEKALDRKAKEVDLAITAVERLGFLYGKGIKALMDFQERRHERELAHELALAEKMPELLTLRENNKYELAAAKLQSENKGMEMMERVNAKTMDYSARFCARFANLADTIVGKLPFQDMPIRELALDGIRQKERTHEARLQEIYVERLKEENHAAVLASTSMLTRVGKEWSEVGKDIKDRVQSGNHETVGGVFGNREQV